MFPGMGLPEIMFNVCLLGAVGCFTVGLWRTEPDRRKRMLLAVGSAALGFGALILAVTAENGLGAFPVAVAGGTFVCAVWLAGEEYMVRRADARAMAQREGESDH